MPESFLQQPADARDLARTAIKVAGRHDATTAIEGAGFVEDTGYYEVYSVSDLLEDTSDVVARIPSYRDGLKKNTRDIAHFGVCTYKGGLKGDQWHGAGSLTWLDGRRYVGQFSRDMFDGEATMTWPDGREYIGQYEQMKKHGHGTFSWPDGRQYHGQWKRGKRHGVGVYTNAKGNQRNGHWVEDKCVSWERVQVSRQAIGGA